MEIEEFNNEFKKISLFSVKCKECAGDIHIQQWSNGSVSIFCLGCKQEELIFPAVKDSVRNLIEEREEVKEMLFK